jgi:integrase/recombinase XerD
MVSGGLRVHELVTLRSRDIDVQERSLRISGKGARERQVFLTNDWTTSLVSAYLTTRRALGIRHDRLLFNSRGGALSSAAMRSRLAKAAQTAEMPARVTPHMLRHTAATQLMEAGVDIRYIQRLLGHASLATTEVYTHVSDAALKRVVTNVDVLGRSFDRR